ncbi:pentapeptide repeat-containing protein [Phormidium pseudopriestleyi FRX01]|uniref:Serine/threonine-protein kinase B n=1 Tax=Phormidium pseudopriestleyi FRX01 TaxID=1759528 RepID=A0ABS3FWK6_9CYAN|nr:serine/threonine-protein kinase [Phormidium pseudopriestleyi]MBO0351510.1 pentapeptide repeat-containing protein [Phormidium pseudopriestleyi FRX01]
MSYCVNPACPEPKNADDAIQCEACGSNLLLRDRYRVLKALGQGGFGATFVAVDDLLPGKPICVIKQLRPASTSPRVLDMARQLFEREAKTLGKIGNHPQVPRLLDYFESDRQFYLVQEYVGGQTLKQETKRNGPLSEFAVKQFLREILPLVKYLHDNKVIHRDIKPANIIRREVDNQLVLIDFGAVKDQVSQTALLNANSTGETAFTSFAIGTPGFAPQEQMALRPVYASDIYAVGATCLYLLTGKSPKHFDYDPMTTELIWRPYVYVSDSFAAVLEKMLAASVRDRYQSPEEALRALDVESHRQTLSEGLSTRRKDVSQQEEETRLEEKNNRALSPAAREVELLRTRRANQKAKAASRGATALNSGMNSHPGLATSFRTQTLAASSGGSDGILDAKAVRLAYGKGKRDFGDCNLTGLDLRSSILSGANFYDAKLNRVNFQGSDLTNANFGRASLIKACLRDANLTKAYFVNANLEGADLRGADLIEASFTQANLRGANLCGANLTGARVSEAQLSMARTNWLTIKPNGKRGIF